MTFCINIRGAWTVPNTVLQLQLWALKKAGHWREVISTPMKGGHIHPNEGRSYPPQWRQVISTPMKGGHIHPNEGRSYPPQWRQVISTPMKAGHMQEGLEVGSLTFTGGWDSNSFPSKESAPICRSRSRSSSASPRLIALTRRLKWPQHWRSLKGGTLACLISPLLWIRTIYILHNYYCNKYSTWSLNIRCAH